MPESPASRRPSSPEVPTSPDVKEAERIVLAEFADGVARRFSFDTLLAAQHAASVAATLRAVCEAYGGDPADPVWATPEGIASVLEDYSGQARANAAALATAVAATEARLAGEGKGNLLDLLSTFQRMSELVEMHTVRQDQALVAKCDARRDAVRTEIITFFAAQSAALRASEEANLALRKALKDVLDVSTSPVQEGLTQQDYDDAIRAARAALSPPPSPTTQGDAP